MSEAGTDRLGTAVRTALAATEPAAVPSFGHMWTRARAASGRPRMQWPLTAAVAASLLAVAAITWLVRPTGPSAEDDYQLARQLVAAHGLGTPTDRWLASAPQTPLAGLPDLPAGGIPTNPEENFL